MTKRLLGSAARSQDVSRRSFLGAAAGAALAAPLLNRSVAPEARTGQIEKVGWTKKKLLVLGGTGFLGPAIVESAVAAGHEVTLFNRGRTNPHLFPELEKLRGNRRRPVREGAPAQDLSALEGRKWDVAIDTCGFFTANVEDSAKLLADQVGQYVYVSSISVYRDIGNNTATLEESSPLAECDDRYAKTMGKEYELYGPLKAACEQAVEAALPGRATLIRPGYIVGPRDRSDRFTYWPLRIARGGEILAPGARDALQQFIDVRDLGAWIVRCSEQQTVGPLNAVGFRGRISTAELLYTGKGTLNHECSFTWVDDAFLQERGVTSWGGMPCWCPADSFNRTSNRLAIDAGLEFRPIAETFSDTLAWAQKARPDGVRGSSISAARERELLEESRAK